jgi:hypothetical protein
MWAVARRVGLVLAILVLAGAAASGVLDRGLDRVEGPLAPDATRAALHRVQLRAAEAYVTARALGRLVAVASSATVNAGVAVGGSLDVGRVLDPIDRLLDTFSDVMMASLVAVTAQLILLDMFDATALSLLLPAGLLVLAGAVAWRLCPHSRVRRVASVLILASVLGKVALPVAVSATEALSARFLQHRAEMAAGVVDATRAEVATAEAAAGEAPRAWYDPRRLTDQLGALSPNDFAVRADRAVDAILTWMTVFLLETMVMPLGIGVAVAILARAAVRRVATVVG